MSTKRRKTLEDEFFPEAKPQKLSNVVYYESTVTNQGKKKFVKSNVVKTSNPPVSTVVQEPAIVVVEEEEMEIENACLTIDSTESERVSRHLSKIREYEKKIRVYQTKIQRLKTKMYG